MNNHILIKMSISSEKIEPGSPRSIWPSIAYTVIPRNLFLQSAITDPDLFINFLATREEGMSKRHLKYSEGPNSGMREYTWERQYRSLLTGEELEQYKNIFTFDWYRIAIARNLEQKWDSYWCRRDVSSLLETSGNSGTSGTIIFSRSISSQVMCEVDVHFSADYVTMYTEKLRVSLESEFDEDFDKRMANWLLMTKFWSIPCYPFPRMHVHSDNSNEQNNEQDEGVHEFLLGGGLESAIVSDTEPAIEDTYQIVRLLNQKINEPYVNLIVSRIRGVPK